MYTINHNTAQPVRAKSGRCTCKKNPWPCSQFTRQQVRKPYYVAFAEMFGSKVSSGLARVLFAAR
eukprot:1193674-Prorocentrum_minimum.AAC.3